MRARTGTFILSCCVKQCVLLLHNPNRGLAGLALGLGINFFSKSDSILVIDNGSIGEISAHFRMLLIGFWNAVRLCVCNEAEAIASAFDHLFQFQHLELVVYYS